MKEFLTINELSDYLNVKRSTLYSLVESGELPHYRIGRLIRFKRGDIDEWMESRRKEGNGTEKKAKGVLRSIRKPNVDIDPVIKKTIAEVKGLEYTSSHGRPGQIKSLRKGVSDGAL